MKIIDNDNYVLKIGNSAQENDVLLTEAQPNDLWFHLEKFSSPHSILNCSDSGIDIIPNAIITWAAQETKACSGKKSKYLQNIGVMYTQVKNVVKTTVEGEVIVKKYKIVKV